MSAVVSKGCQLLLSDQRGVYIPRDFAEGFDLKSWHIDFDVSALSDPDSDLYWDTWERVVSSAFLLDAEGNCFTLHNEVLHVILLWFRYKKSGLKPLVVRSSD